MLRTEDRAWWQAVGAQLERGVRQQRGAQNNGLHWRQMNFALHTLGRHKVWTQLSLQHSRTIARVRSDANRLAAVSGVLVCSRRLTAGAALETTLDSGFEEWNAWLCGKGVLVFGRRLASSCSRKCTAEMGSVRVLRRSRLVAAQFTPKALNLPRRTANPHLAA